MRYTTRKVTLSSGGAKLKLLVLIPSDGGRTDRPGVLWLHGGGYKTGMAGMAHISRARDLVRRYGAVVVSPAYRLAGRAPYPAALLDCHRALLYLRRHASELGVRSDQLMVGGESAGGGLAAALCMFEKDTGGVKVAFQMPLYPMLDCRDTVTSRDNHSPVWNTRRNRAAWRKYLRGTEGEAPCYASPARRSDCSGLPPAYTFVSTAEPFYAETLDYIHSLKNAGVEARADVYPGLFHAFDMLLPFLRQSREAAARFGRSFEYAAAHCFAPQQGGSGEQGDGQRLQAGDADAVEVAAALIWDKGRFMICRRPAHKARGQLWEFVGGKAEPGETPAQALVRECAEELAVRVRVLDPFTDVLHRYPDITVHLTVFNAVIVRGEPQKLEHSDIRWITPQEIPDYDFCPADSDILRRIALLYGVQV